MSARDEVSDFWNSELADWCAGRREPSSRLRPWMGSYVGHGDGKVDMNAFPEPWIGSLTGAPRVVVLGLNPGRASLEFQGSKGVFTHQIARSSYTEWAASEPYSSAGWEQARGMNVYHRNRLVFARRFHDDPSISASELLLMELFPWHSDRVTAPMRPPRSVLDEFVLAPIGDLDTEFVFAFGKPWLSALAQVGLVESDPLDVAWSTPSRAAVPFRLSTGQSVLVLTQSGYAGPPGAADTAALRAALGVAL